ncbi:MAG: DUF1648 domain-containing protein [Bacteroidia bacterium]
MPYRPKIKIPLTPTDKAIEITGVVSVIAFWGYLVVSYSSLPDVIPTHYGGSGKADGFGDKISILGLPIVATILYIGITILNRFPHVFNYPSEITPENAVSQYTIMTRMMRWLKLVVVIIFGSVAYQTVVTARSADPQLGSWFLPLTMVLLYGTIFYFITKSISK